MTRYEVKDVTRPEVVHEVRLTGYTCSLEGTTIIRNPMNTREIQLGSAVAHDNDTKPINSQGKDKQLTL